MEHVDPTIGGTVWILGAGFSRGLGAPLFRELFVSDKRARAAGLDLPGRVYDVIDLYRRFREGTNSGENELWRDPEEFIDVLESAKSPGRSQALLATLTRFTPDELVDAARRLLALECSQFLRGAVTDTERWLPYLMWASRLDETHTVISFNYDRVLEFVQKQKFREQTNYYSVIVPSEADTNGVWHARTMKCAPILKLHGSVDWITRNGKIDVDPRDSLPADAASGNDLVLAVPGPEKGGFGKKFRAIGVLWKGAEEAVQRAGRVVFLGYRFPVTDAQARIRFLNAIKFATKGNTLKTVEVVLGPDDKHPDVARMKQLLSFVCGGSTVKVKVHPLYVEDFLPYSAETP
jgi:hypothetical protein